MMSTQTSWIGLKSLFLPPFRECLHLRFSGKSLLLKRAPVLSLPPSKNRNFWISNIRLYSDDFSVSEQDDSEGPFLFWFPWVYNRPNYILVPASASPSTRHCASRKYWYQWYCPAHLAHTTSISESNLRQLESVWYIPTRLNLGHCTRLPGQPADKRSTILEGGEQWKDGSTIVKTLTSGKLERKGWCKWRHLKIQFSISIFDWLTEVRRKWNQIFWATLMHQRKPVVIQQGK